MIGGAFARVYGGAEGGGPVVVGSPAGAFLLVTLTSEDPNEGQLELTAVAGVDDGVQAAVEVSEPEDYFEEDLRRSKVHIKRPWGQQKADDELVEGQYSVIM